MAHTYLLPSNQESFNHINLDLPSIKNNNSTRVVLLLHLVKTNATCLVLHLVRFQTRIQDKLNFNNILSQECKYDRRVVFSYSTRATRKEKTIKLASKVTEQKMLHLVVYLTVVQLNAVASRNNNYDIVMLHLVTTKNERANSTTICMLHLVR